MNGVGEVGHGPKRRPRRGPPPLPTVIRFKEDVFGEKKKTETQGNMNPTRAFGTKICHECKKHVLETAVACGYCGTLLVTD